MHGLKWYDYGARWYDPLLVNWNRPDPSHKDYYPWSPYAYCGDNPMNAVDPDGRDFWSTNNKKLISAFMNAVGSGKKQFDFSDWQHATDKEIIGNLIYDDKKKKFYTSYVTTEDGELNVISKSFNADLKPVSFTGEGYVGAFVYEPLNDFFSVISHFLNGTTYFDGTTNWNVNLEGRIIGVVPIIGIAPSGGRGKNNIFGGKQKMGHSINKMSANHNVQNKQIRALGKRHHLTEDEIDLLHREVSHQGYGYWEIDEIIYDLFGK